MNTKLFVTLRLNLFIILIFFNRPSSKSTYTISSLKYFRKYLLRKDCQGQACLKLRFKIKVGNLSGNESQQLSIPRKDGRRSHQGKEWDIICFLNVKN